ncbi:MAG: TPM domain-containing protein [Desulfopila sp.]|nr:TPM domain-containing protein [Desulfopila sp.]
MAVLVEAVVVLVEAVPREDGDMQHPAQRFLSKKEQFLVTEAVKNAEKRTSGEIVPMIVSSSYDYPKAKLIAALLFSLPLALFLSHLLAGYVWLDPKNVYVFLSLLLPLFFLSNRIITVYPSLARIFISQEEMDIEVQEEAMKSFFNEKLYATRDANGILLFISVFEKKVWILADRNIREKIPQQQWDDLVSELMDKISSRERCTALCNTITQIGDLLAQHFPGRRDDTDELHNLIIRP